MTEVMNPSENAAIVLELLSTMRMTDDQFFEFCQINRELRIEVYKLRKIKCKNISKMVPYSNRPSRLRSVPQA